MAAACLLAILALPPSRAVFAAWVTRISLGRFAVVVTPEVLPALDVRALTQDIASMEEARRVMPFALLKPEHLPEGCILQSLRAVTYQGMPEWVPQPFYLEMNYGLGEDARDDTLTVRQFAISFGPNREVNRLGFRPEEVQRVQEMTVGSDPAVLVELGRKTTLLRELIWQHNDIAIELTSRTLTAGEMLAVAESMR